MVYLFEQDLSILRLGDQFPLTQCGRGLVSARLPEGRLAMLERDGRTSRTERWEREREGQWIRMRMTEANEVEGE